MKIVYLKSYTFVKLDLDPNSKPTANPKLIRSSQNKDKKVNK